MRTRLLAALTAALAVGLLAPSAAPAAARVPATLQLPAMTYLMHPGLASIWLLSSDEYRYSILYRVDPHRMTVTETIPLGYPAAEFTVGYGSVWVTDYYGNLLHRYAPSGREQAVIPVGLQPQFVHSAFGSIWTSDHHGHSLTRVDPATNGVIATVNVGARMFRDGPQEFTWNQSYLYASSANTTYLQRVDPQTDRVTNLADIGRIASEGDFRWAPGRLGGTLWGQNLNAIKGFDVLGAVRTRILPLSGNRIQSLTLFGGKIWYVQFAPGATTSTVTGADSTTGATLSSFAVQGRVTMLRSGYGYLWAIGREGLLQRASTDAPTP